MSPRPAGSWRPAHDGTTTTRFKNVYSDLVTKDLSNMAGNSGNDDEHLEDLEDGAGCTEIWEKLSEHRAEGMAADD